MTPFMRKPSTPQQKALCSVLFVSAVVICASSALYTMGSTPRVLPEYVTAHAAATFTFSTSTDPRRLRIPRIGVDAAVESVGNDLVGGNAIGTPSNFTNVGWYNKGPLPGAIGTAVIDGHLSGKKIPHAVFYYLHTLHQGDIVEVDDSTGTIQIFTVLLVKTYTYTDTTDEVFQGDTSHRRLNLITCGGRWMPQVKLFSERTVVYTERIL